MFRSWPELLSSDVELWPARLPGHQDRLHDPPFTSVGRLARAVADELIPIVDEPLALFGHSFGALVVFEVARELRRRRAAPPLALFVASCAAPHLMRRRRALHELSDAAFLRELRLLGGIPEEVAENEELLQLVLPTLRAEIALADTYVYEPAEPLDVPIFAFGGVHDHVSYDDQAKWREHTSGPFEIQMFPGNHFFFTNRERRLVAAIGARLRAQLEREEGSVEAEGERFPQILMNTVGARAWGATPRSDRRSSEQRMGGPREC